MELLKYFIDSGQLINHVKVGPKSELFLIGDSDNKEISYTMSGRLDSPNDILFEAHEAVRVSDSKRRYVNSLCCGKSGVPTGTLSLDSNFLKQPSYTGKLYSC